MTDVRNKAVKTSSPPRMRICGRLSWTGNWKCACPEGHQGWHSFEVRNPASI